MDHISYSKIFTYLNENHKFTAKIIHSDYEKAISLAIKEIKCFDKNIIHSRCFFHFSQMVKNKLSKVGIFKKKMNKLSIEIITNIELLCFINLENIKEFQNIIIKKLESYEKINGFINYLKKYILKIDPNVYNYSQLIEHFKIENEENKFLDKLYTSNNICESLNSKISLYLPKKVTDNYNFVSSLTKILSNDLIEDNAKIFRKDYKTRTLLKLIDEMDLNNNLKWIEYENIKIYMRQIIIKNNEKLQNKDIENLINYINEEREEPNITEVDDVENNMDNGELKLEDSINEIDIEQIDISNEDFPEVDENEESEDINIINNNTVKDFILLALNLYYLINFFIGYKILIYNLCFDVLTKHNLMKLKNS